MRGKVVFYMKFVQHHRITPAYAGKSRRRQHRQPEGQDHPRLCGEKSAAFPCKIHPLGSPPPMRGKEWSPL